MSDRNPFEPIGERARWKILYEEFVTAKVGDTLTYGELGNLLNLEPMKDRGLIQGAVRRAAKELLTVDQRAIEAVRGQGYRIVEPREQLRLAQNYQTRASRSLVRGKSQVTHVDFNGMDSDVRQAFEVTGRAFSALLDMNRRLDTRQGRLEKNLKSMSTKQERTEEELQAIKTRLAQLEEVGL